MCKFVNEKYFGLLFGSLSAAISLIFKVRNPNFTLWYTLTTIVGEKVIDELI